MQTIADRLHALGLTLPPTPAPAGNYLPFRKNCGNSLSGCRFPYARRPCKNEVMSGQQGGQYPGLCLLRHAEPVKNYFTDTICAERLKAVFYFIPYFH